MPVCAVPLSSPGSSLEWFVPTLRSLYAALMEDQILILIFAEVLGLYGLIVALILNTNADPGYTVSPPPSPP